MATTGLLPQTQQLKPSATSKKTYDSDEDDNIRRYNLNTTLPSQKYMADLLAICTGIGVTEEEHFPDGRNRKVITKGDDCEECIHDLQRYLRRDDGTKSMHRFLGSAGLGVLQNKLLPLITTYHLSDTKLVFSVTKVLVMLTMPPEENGAMQDVEMQDLVKYKEAFLSQDVVGIFVSMLEEPLSHDGFDRTDDDNMLIELILTLFRNLLHVPNPEYSSTSGGEHLTHLQEDFIVLLHKELVLETVLLLAQLIENEANRDWNLLLLELFYLLFRGQSPVSIASENGQQHLVNVNSSSSSVGKTSSRIGNNKRIPPRGGYNNNTRQNFDPLANMLVNEHRERIASKRSIGARHSKFGGAYVLNHNDAFALHEEKQSKMVLHSAWVKTEDALKSRQPKNKSVRLKQREVDMAAAKTAAITGVRPDAFTVGYGYGKTMSAPMATRQRDVRLVLKDFATQFIKKAYPALMRSLVKDFRRESTRLLPSDMIQYIFITAFCTSFHRRMEDLKLLAMKAKRKVQRSIGVESTESNNHSFDWGPVAATMDLWSFHFIVKSIDRYVELKDWVATGVAVAGLKEMILVLDRLRKSGDAEKQRIANSLINVVFYEREIIDLVPRLLGRCHSAAKHISSWFVTDLVETAHVILDITEHLAEHKMFVLQRRRKKKKKIKMKPWNTEEIAALEEGVKKYGRGKFEKILKSSDFGPVLEGRMAAELKLKLSMVKKLRKEGKEVTSDAEEEEDDEEKQKEKEEEAKEASIRRECEFKFNTFLNKFAQNSVYQVYLRLLHTYRTNSVKVNHCIVKLFYRLTQLILDEWNDEDDKKVVVTHEPVLFQLSTLMVFNRILNDHRIAKKSGFQELIEFSKATVRHFFRLAQKNPLLYVEALFNRQRRANEAIISVYDPDAGMSSSERRKKQKDGDYDPKKTSSNALNEADLDGEEEATFDASKYGKLAKTRAEALAKAADDKKRSRRQSRRWTHQEDALLQMKFPQLRHLDAVYEILSFEELLQDKDRTPSQIKNRVKSLGLLDGTVNRTGQEGIFGISDAQVKKQVTKILELHVMAGAAATENAGREALKTLDNRLSACAKFREEQEERRLAMIAMGDGDEDDELAMLGSVGFALVPVTQDEFAQLSNRWVHSLLRTLKFREPATGECFWRIPGALNAKECRERLTLLRRTIREIDTMEDDSMSKEVGYDDGMKEYDASELRNKTTSNVDGDEGDDEKTAKILNNKKYFLESALGMMLSESIQGKVSADRISSGLWETFRFEIFERSGFTIKSHHGHYLSVNSENVLCSTAAGAKPGKNEKFNFEYKNDKLLIKHARTGMYVSATDDGKVECKSTMVGSTSMWRAVVSKVGDGDDDSNNDNNMMMMDSSNIDNLNNSSSKKQKKHRIASLYESSDDDSDDEFTRAFLGGDNNHDTPKKDNVEGTRNVAATTSEVNQNNKRSPAPGADDEEDDSDDELEVVQKTKHVQKRRKMMLDDDDDDDDDE